MNISSRTLDKVNSIRTAAGKAHLSMAELKRLFDWRDEPKSSNATHVGLRRLTAILGFEVKNNADGGCVYLTGTPNRITRKLAITLGVGFFEFENSNPMGPQGYRGPAILVPDDIIQLAQEASREMLKVWQR